MRSLLPFCFLLGLLASPGCVYMNVVSPLDTDVEATQLGTKVGKATAQSILGLVAWGDRGTQAAAANGGITHVHHMDVQTFAILFFVYVKQTTIVYGE